MALARDAVLRDLKARLAQLERPSCAGSLMHLAGEEVEDAALAPGALHEVLAETPADRAAALGFLMGLLARFSAVAKGPFLWVQSLREEQESGFVYGPGLTGFGMPPDRFLFVSVRTDKDLLWALEEGAKARGCLAVAGLLGEARACGLTQSRRLHLAAEDARVPVLLFRGSGAAMPSAAETRWRIAPAPSRPPEWDAEGLGAPRWSVTLERQRRGIQKTWVMEWDHAACAFAVVAPMADRPARPASIAGRGHAA